MPTVSLTGQDTLVIGGIVLTDVADGDWFTVTYDNDLANLKRGKNGNSIFAENSMGPIASATLRLIRASDDDKTVDALLQQQLQDFSSFVLLDGQFTKRAGDGLGNVASDTYKMAGGIFKRQVDAKSNAEGDTEQSVSIYRFEFSDVSRQVF
jgi:hypothetical protein